MPSLAELSPYNPTWRDRIAAFMMGDGKASPERRAFVEGLVGSSGLGNKGMSLADLSPVGAAFQANEARTPQEMSLAAIGVLPGAGAVQRAVPKVERGIIAYHGSPHSFDRFDLSKIGTGEGAQAYGHGLYFAENEDVARQYRSALAGAPTVNYGSSPYAHAQSLKEVNEYINANPQGRFVDSQRKSVMESAAKLIFDEAAGGSLASKPLSQLVASYPEDVRPQVQSWVSEAEKIIRPNLRMETPGSMYQVRINADPEHFLDWDKSLREQPEIVRRKLGWTPEAEAQYLSAQSADDDALLATLNDEGSYKSARIPVPAGLPPLSATGEDIVRGRSVFDRASDVERANRLREAGIPGLKYLDQGSRGVGEGSRNYVVFDDKLIDILRKYGLGALGIGLPAAAAMQGAQPQANGPSM